MLRLLLPAIEEVPALEVHLEHSLVSLSKWESATEKAFFKREGLTAEETISYIRTMAIDDDLPEDWVERLSEAQFQKINEFLNSRQSATWFREDETQNRSHEVVTSEVIYHWMIQFQIPFEPCQHWHLNRLMSQIKVEGIKSTKPKKMSATARAHEFAKLNAQRRQALGTTG